MMLRNQPPSPMTRIFDLLAYQQEKHPLENCINARQEDGSWRPYSSREIAETAEKAAAGLLKLGLTKGDRVALVSYKNRPEWLIMDFAIQMAGMVSVPLYPTISIGEYEYILNEAGVKAAFCGEGDLHEKLGIAGKNTPSLDYIFTFDRQANRSFWEDILDPGGVGKLQEIKQGITGEDLVTIIYTSGTTGNPKGVMLNHSNIMYAVITTADLVPIRPGEKTISFLPMCHIYERAVSFAYYYRGYSVYYCGTDNLSGPEGDLASVRPAGFTAVPRLLEKIYEAIYNKGLELKGIKRALFFWSLSLTDDFSLDKKRTLPERLKWALADRLIFSKWRKALGGNLRVVFTAAAPCPVKILRLFCAAGI
ncbi:MAG: AMP-binding protein, partial [Robiginitalea sp.]